MLVNQMVPLTPKGSSNWFIDEVNAAISQGKVCVGFQWIAAMGGLLDPKSSKLGKTKEEILKKLAFAPLPKQDTDKVPLGGMGLHVSQVHPGGEAGRGAELHQVVPDARGPEEVGAARRRAGPQRRPQLARVPRGAAVQQGVHGVGSASEGLLEPARVREAPERPLDRRSTRRSPARRSPTRRSTSWRPRSRPSSTRAATKQRLTREAGLSPTPGLLTSRLTTDMADTLQTPPTGTAAARRLEAPPAAKRFRFLTDRRLAGLFIAPALALLLFLSIWPLIRLIWLSFTDYSVTRDVPASFIGFDNYVDVLTSPIVQKRALTTLIFVVGAVALQTIARLRDRVPDLAPHQGPRRAHDALPDPDDAVAGRRRPVLEVHARRAVRRRELVPGQPRARPRRVADPAAPGAASR